MRAENPKLLSEAILFLLYQEALRSGNNLEPSHIVAKLVPVKVTKLLVSFALDELKARRFIEQINVTKQGYTSISRSGYDYVRYRLSLSGSAIHSFSKSPEWLLSEEKPGDDAPLDKSSDDSSTDSSVNTVPASDRVVKRNDNEEAWSGAVAGTKELESALVKINNLDDLSDEQFEQKLSEVRALQIMLDSPQVQWDLLNQFAEKTVKYLAVQFADNAVGMAATGLMGFLGTLLASLL
jgi:hypothetical protein